MTKEDLLLFLNEEVRSYLERGDIFEASRIVDLIAKLSTK